MPHSSPVRGCQPKPMVLRNPVAKIVRDLPSGLARSMVAASVLVSLHALQVDPTLMYSMLSGPKAMVRLGCCPPSGRSSMIRSILSTPPSPCSVPTNTSLIVAI